MQSLSAQRGAGAAAAAAGCRPARVRGAAPAAGSSSGRVVAVRAGAGKAKAAAPTTAAAAAAAPKTPAAPAAADKPQKKAQPAEAKKQQPAEAKKAAAPAAPAAAQKKPAAKAAPAAPAPAAAAADKKPQPAEAKEQQPAPKQQQPVAACTSVEDVQFINPMWSAPSSEAEFLGLLDKLVAAGKCPPALQAGWVDFYKGFRATIESSGVPDAEKVATKIQATIADTVFNQILDPYTFPSAHSRLLEPYNYYAFGQRYVGSLVNFNDSFLGHAELWDKVSSQIAAGENVVLLANHQTEADPGVFAHMLSASHPNLATDVFYVAGDRVVTDPLCKPFSMGRNLFCVHSKKHLGDVPELKAAKMETNRKTLVAMQRAFNTGGALVWIAPSGGRDRPNADGVWAPDAFDPAAVELMASLVGRAKKPGHLYPLAMYSYPIMPPPKQVEANIGERRVTAHSGVGISLCPELDVAAVTEAAGGDKEARAALLAKAAYEAVAAEYKQLEAAITRPEARASMQHFTQPFLAGQAATAAAQQAAAAAAAKK